MKIYVRCTRGVTFCRYTTLLLVKPEIQRYFGSACMNVAVP